MVHQLPGPVGHGVIAPSSGMGSIDLFRFLSWWNLNVRNTDEAKLKGLMSGLLPRGPPDSKNTIMLLEQISNEASLNCFLPYQGSPHP